jgi:ABC-2 type transport system permease protein
MNLVWTHVRTGVVEFARMPQYWVPSMAFPTIFFALFGITNAVEPADGVGNEVLLANFLCFGLLTIMFFQFGVGIADDRRQPWEVTLRVLPASGAVRFAGRVGVALVFSVAALIPAIVLAAVTTELRLSALEWPAFLAALLLGAVPFGLMGITLGFAASPKAALPIANLGFLGLSFLGGLFVPLEGLPGFVRDLAPWLPSRHYLNLVYASVGAGDDLVTPALYLVGWTVLFLVLAVLVYRRDEGVRYR